MKRFKGFVWKGLKGSCGEVEGVGMKRLKGSV